MEASSFSNVISSFQIVLSPISLILATIGVFGGMVFGAMPGLTAVMAITIALPFTFFMSPSHAIILLIAIDIGAISGGFISACSLNMPGTPSSVATTFDGYPMGQKGKLAEAFGISIISSGTAGLVSGVILIFAAPVLAKIALKFGPFEYFSLGIFTFLAISGLMSGDLWKNLLGVAVGLVIASIGSDPITGLHRFTFNISNLSGGIALLPFMVGIFVLPQLIDDITSFSDVMIPQNVHNIQLKHMLPDLKFYKDQAINYIRSFLIGIGIGIMPGIGGTTSNVISYEVARSYSKYPEKFGTGIPDGVVASETANNASIGGAFITWLGLGIPGDAVTAILLGALMIHGIQPGPLLFKNHPVLVNIIFATNLISNIIMILMGFFLIKWFIKILGLHKKFLLPIITIFCILGAYSTNNRIFDIWVVIFFGIFGFIWKKLGLSLVPVLIAYILQPIVEKGIREGISISKGSFLPLVSRPISLTLLIMGFLSVLLGTYMKHKVNERNKDQVLDD